MKKLIAIVTFIAMFLTTIMYIPHTEAATKEDKKTMSKNTQRDYSNVDIQHEKQKLQKLHINRGDCNVYVWDAEKLADITWTNIVCTKNNTIDQNIEARYGDLRHIIASTNIGLGLERTKNMQTMCNAIADTLNHIHVGYQAFGNSEALNLVRKFIYITAKADKAVSKSKEPVEEHVLRMTGKLWDYSHSKFISRNRQSAYAFLTSFLDIMKASKGNMPQDFKALLAAYLKADAKQALKIISSSVQLKEIDKVSNYCSAIEKEYFSYRDDCINKAMTVDKQRGANIAQKDVDDVIVTCRAAYNIYADPYNSLVRAIVLVNWSLIDITINKNYDDAIKKLNEAIEIYHTKKNKTLSDKLTGEMQAYAYLYDIYDMKGDFKKTKEISEKMIQLLTSITEDVPPYWSVSTYLYSAEAYIKNGDKAKATADIQRAQDIMTKCGEKCKNDGKYYLEWIESLTQKIGDVK